MNRFSKQQDICFLSPVKNQIGAKSIQYLYIYLLMNDLEDQVWNMIALWR